MEEDPIVVLALLADLKDTFDNFGVCDGEAVGALAYFLSNGAKKEYDAYTANGLSTDGHV